MTHRRRFEVLLPMCFPDGTAVPTELITQTQGDVQYQFPKRAVEQQISRGFHRETCEQCDRHIRLFVDVGDTAENLAYFYKLKLELKERFRQEEIAITTFLVGVL